ncbi:hypothetical protein, no similarity [Geotrichum candidum]|uniref:Uncharacterized protein n=1 Tax=Geotrichum candidum TaxID=1173061 RepID=A0A0J9X2U4_GEOCN|nr:hypothetical protein, no similarity [Geotrichum candidum]
MTFANLSYLPFDIFVLIAEKLHCSVLNGSDYFSLEEFTVVPIQSKVKLNPHGLLKLRLVCRSLKFFVDSFLYKSISIEPNDAYSLGDQSLLDPTSTFSQAFRINNNGIYSRNGRTKYNAITSLLNNRFVDRFEEIDKKFRYTVIYKSESFTPHLSASIFQHVVNLFIQYSVDKSIKEAVVSPPLDHLVPQNFPMLREVFLFLCAHNVPENDTRTLANFFRYHSGSVVGKVRVKCQVSMKLIARVSRFPIYLLSDFEVASMVESLYIQDSTGTPIDYEAISQSLINLKKLSIICTGNNSDYRDAIENHSTIQRLDGLEELTIYSSHYPHNPVTSLSFLPNNLTRLSIHIGAFIVATLKRNDNCKFSQPLKTVQQLQLYAMKNNDTFQRLLGEICCDVTPEYLDLEMSRLNSIEMSLFRNAQILDVLVLQRLLQVNNSTVKHLHVAVDDGEVLDKIFYQIHSITDLFLEIHTDFFELSDLFFIAPGLHQVKRIFVHSKPSVMGLELNQISTIFYLLLKKGYMPNLEIFSGFSPFLKFSDPVSIFEFSTVTFGTNIQRFLERRFDKSTIPNVFDLFKPVILNCNFSPVAERDVDSHSVGSFIHGQFSLDVKLLRSMRIKPEAEWRFLPDALDSDEE